jgi:rhodanese-related sulfurtransferase
MKRWQASITLAAVGLLLLFAAPARAIEEFEPGIKIIGTDELKNLLDKKTDMLLINALSPFEFRDMAIPNSINMPYEYIQEGKVSLPEDKNKMLVFY